MVRSFSAAVCCLALAAPAAAAGPSGAPTPDPLAEAAAALVVAYRPRWHSRPAWSGATYPAAIAFCAARSAVLCPRAALCPRGRDGPPYGGVREGPAGSWAPIADRPNAWVSVGGEGTCRSRSEGGAAPLAVDAGAAGAQEEVTRHVLCCLGPRPAAGAAAEAAPAHVSAEQDAEESLAAWFAEAAKNHASNGTGNHQNTGEDSRADHDGDRPEAARDDENGDRTHANRTHEGAQHAEAAAAAPATAVGRGAAARSAAAPPRTTAIAYACLFLGGLVAGVLAGRAARRRRGQRRGAGEGGTAAGDAGESRPIAPRRSGASFALT